MRTGVPAGAALLALALAGCMNKQAGCKTGPLAKVGWTLHDSSGAPKTCLDVGGEHVNLTLSGMKYSFDCTAGTGTTGMLPAPGMYTALGDLVNGAGLTLDMKGPIEVNVAACGVTDVGTFDFAVSATCASSPTILLSWSLATRDGTPTDCDTAGAATVELHVGAMTSQFTCNSYAGMTDVVQPGTYPTNLTLSNAGGQVLSMTQTMDLVVGCTSFVSLTNVMFVVN